MRKADEEAEIISDWKFAAMVVDRFDRDSFSSSLSLRMYFNNNQFFSLSLTHFLADFVYSCLRYLQ